MTVTHEDTRGAIFIDPLAYADQETWHAVAADLRADAPVLRVEAEGYTPFWAVTRYEDVFDVSRHNDRFLNTRNSVLGPDMQFEMLGTLGIEPKTLIHMDGVEHREHRAVANTWFRPRAVSQRQAAIDAIAEHFVDRFRELGGRCDFAQDIAVPYTLRVIMSIFGVPAEDEATMLRLTQGLFGAADPEYLGDLSDPFTMITETIGEFEEYFATLAAERRAHPADDLATVIANAEVGGCPMDRHATMWYFTIVATAGHDTTSFALTGGLEALIRHPAQVRALQQDPSLVPNAAEEMIRWTSPVRHFLRYLTEPAVLSGVRVPAGDRLLLSYPSANRDERVFDEPMRFDVTRPNANRTLAFGGGEHFCLGSTFARREIRTILPKLLAAVEDITLDGDPEHAQANFVGGVKHLPVLARFR
ncbi:MAG TPA: cytochrome P450 [Acidimicrobiales bacterium]|nr:cytochrome P450 [Acidimicrobiales bacterium]